MICRPDPGGSGVLYKTLACVGMFHIFLNIFDIFIYMFDMLIDISICLLIYIYIYDLVWIIMARLVQHI